jgi:hypothetical protein
MSRLVLTGAVWREKTRPRMRSVAFLKCFVRLRFSITNLTTMVDTAQPAPRPSTRPTIFAGSRPVLYEPMLQFLGLRFQSNDTSRRCPSV